ncbi:hypothetical protein GZL_08150 [Streptomyces sp. 769]|nr:hypothetical protein GZL_08150 [Streptomyces sp. 769]
MCEDVRDRPVATAGSRLRWPDQGDVAVDRGSVLVADGGGVCVGRPPGDVDGLPVELAVGVGPVVPRPGKGGLGGWLVGAGSGLLGEGLVAGATGAGRSGRSATAVATPPPKARHTAAAKPATRRRRARLARSAM